MSLLRGYLADSQPHKYILDAFCVNDFYYFVSPVKHILTDLGKQSTDNALD